MLLPNAIFLPQTVEAEETVHFDGLHGQVRLASRTDYDKEERGSRSRTTTTSLLEEELTVGTSGWVYDPGLMEFDGLLSLIPQQTYADSDELGSGSETGDYNVLSDIRLLMLSKKAYPITLFTSQNISYVQPPLGELQKEESSRYGVGLRLPRLAIGKFRTPMRLTFQHEEVEWDNRSGRRASEERLTDRFNLEMKNSTRRSQTSLEYEFESEDVKRTSGQRRPTQDRHELRLDHNRRFSYGKSISRLFLSDYQDGVHVKTIRFSENLSLEHSPSLLSTYFYSLDGRDADNRDQTRHRVRAGLRHQWYQSLTTRLTAEGNFYDSDVSDGSQGVGELNLYYRKIIPGGILGLRFIPRYTREDDDFDTRTGSVIAESHPVDISQLMQLRRPSVETSTIRVVDPVTLTLFIEDSDYRVLVSGARTALEIIPGGDLDPGFTTVVPPATGVEVDYDFEAAPSRSFSSLSTSSTLTLDLWDMLSLDVNYSDLDVDVDEEGFVEASGVREDPALADANALQVELELRSQGHRVKLEYRDIDELINPRKTYRAEYAFEYRSASNINMRSSFSYYHEDASLFDRSQDNYFLDLVGSAPLPMNIYSRVSLLLRRLEGSEQDQTNSTCTINLNYRYGRLLFELEEQITWKRFDNKSGLSGSNGSPDKVKRIHNRFLFTVTRPF